MSEADLTTAEGMIAFATGYGERLRAMFNDSQKTIPLVGVVATWDPERQASFDPPKAMILAMPDLAYGQTFAAAVDSKREGAAFTRFLVKESKAIGVATAMEVWLSNDDKYRNRDFAEDPARKEGIFLLAEHIRLKGPHVRMATITRNALGRGTAGPFVDPYEGKEVRLKGRFVDLLDRTRFA